MPEFTIPAEVHTDDHSIKIEFDAVTWFEQASDKEIVDLANCNWRGDYPADAVAQDSMAWRKDIDRVFNHFNPDKNLGGFECSVNEEKAVGWLQENKPEIAKII